MPAKRPATIADPKVPALGTVMFTDWKVVPWSAESAIGLHGQVSVHSGEDLLGFKVEGGGHANWLIRITGPTGVVVAIPGCKVDLVIYGSEPAHRGVALVP